MKNKVIGILLIVFFAACQSATNTASTQSEQAFDIKKYAGYWVTKAYTEDLAKTRSPYKSNEKLFGIAALQISDSNLVKNLLTLPCSMNNHEGCAYVFNLSQKDANGFYAMSESQCGDTVSISFVNGNSIILKSATKTTEYIKVADLGIDSGDFGISYFAADKLLVGTYKVNNQEVSFKSGGKMTDFEGFTNYYLITDFAGGGFDTSDYVQIGTFEKGVLYGIKFTSDGFELHETKTSTDGEPAVLVPEIKYKFVKK